MFIVQATGPNVIKLFTGLFCNKKCFIPGRPLQPKLMVVGKARSLPRVEHLKSALLVKASGLKH